MSTIFRPKAPSSVRPLTFPSTIFAVRPDLHPIVTLPELDFCGHRQVGLSAKISFLQLPWSYVIGMNAMQIEYPEAWTAAAGSTAERFESEARMALAMKLIEMGRLTSGQAAQLAGVSRITFLLNCPQWNVCAVNWDAAELASEFKPLPA